VLKDQTIATLKRLEGIDWFYAVGQKDTEQAIVLTSWDEAVTSCACNEWEDLLLEATNRYCQKLASLSGDRFGHWNELVREAKKITEPLVASKIEKTVKNNNLPKIIVDTVNWDILHLLMEAEFADVYPPGFYASQGYWYVHGHFPCGWKGEFPEGILIIY